mmetsp:Transcript_161934/g.514514  ORF Transcript_161934/g.514514 Transcript_161934/m.514514 type:complete len:380 (-) Transcript_161934:1185-2324(-)
MYGHISVYNHTVRLCAVRRPTINAPRRRRGSEFHLPEDEARWQQHLDISGDILQHDVGRAVLRLRVNLLVQQHHLAAVVVLERGLCRKALVHNKLVRVRFALVGALPDGDLPASCEVVCATEHVTDLREHRHGLGGIWSRDVHLVVVSCDCRALATVERLWELLHKVGSRERLAFVVRDRLKALLPRSRRQRPRICHDGAVFELNHLVLVGSVANCPLFPQVPRVTTIITDHSVAQCEVVVQLRNGEHRFAIFLAPTEAADVAVVRGNEYTAALQLQCTRWAHTNELPWARQCVFPSLVRIRLVVTIAVAESGGKFDHGLCIVERYRVHIEAEEIHAPAAIRLVQRVCRVGDLVVVRPRLAVVVAVHHPDFEVVLCVGR